MSEDDRAAKAARAKALLKKRQAKKVGGDGLGPGAATPATGSPPISRTGTPALPDVPPKPEAANHERDVGDLFSSNGKNDASWIGSLERVSSPPLARSPPPSSARSPPASASAYSPPPSGIPRPQSSFSPPAHHHHHSPQFSGPSRSASPRPASPAPTNGGQPNKNGVRRGSVDVGPLQQQLVTLESENKSLRSSLQRLGNVEGDAKELARQLQEERGSSTKLQQRIDQLSSQAGGISSLQQTIATLQSQNASLSQLVESRDSRVRELETQLQEITKLKQSASTLEAKSRKTQTMLDAERTKTAKLETQIRETEGHLAEIPALKKNMSSLEDERAALTAKVKRLSPFENATKQAEDLLKQEKERSQALENQCHVLEAHVQDYDNQKQTISFLVSEKASLTASLDRLGDIESEARNFEDQLGAERRKSQTLEERVQQLEGDATAASQRLQELVEKEKDAEERIREQERNLQHTKASLSDLRTEADRYRRRMTELQEQIQNDDRAERLEESLKHTQDRADELEFKLSKLQQAHSTLKTEREQVDAQIKQLSASETEWHSKHEALHNAHGTVRSQLEAMTRQRDALTHEKSKLESKAQASQHTLAELQKKLAHAEGEAANHARQLHAAQVELRHATRRAEESERAQQDVQAEGSILLRSLEEMRAKVVELTNQKLELSERVEGLDSALRKRDNLISEMETSLHELEEQKEEALARHQESETLRVKDQSSTQEDLASLQKAYRDLQEELESSKETLATLEEMRGSQTLATTRREEEMGSLKHSAREQRHQLAAVQAELDERRRAEAEQREFLDRAMTDIETLETELAARDEEIQSLRQTVSTLPPGSLDEEMLSALHQQHELDVSAAQSHIRTLETRAFDAEARAHALQKTISALEDQLAQRSATRSTPAPGARPFSPGHSPRSSRDHGDELRRTSFAARRPSGLGGAARPPARSALEYSMSPETRHKRRISLGMLKVRMDSELGVPAVPSRSHTPALPAVAETEQAATPRAATPVAQPFVAKRSQFLDESHIFWCHSCRGDLVIL